MGRQWLFFNGSKCHLEWNTTVRKFLCILNNKNSAGKTYAYDLYTKQCTQVDNGGNFDFDITNFAFGNWDGGTLKFPLVVSGAFVFQGN